jgi:hypothetical protein
MRRDKKEPRASILGAYSSLCLRLFCPGDFGGVGGTGVSRRQGLLAVGVLPDPARVIHDRHHNLQHFEQSRRIGRRRSVSQAEPLWCLIGGRTIRTGKGVLGRPKETFVH